MIGVGLNLVAWQPPILWTSQFGTQGYCSGNKVTEVLVDSTGFYAAGYNGYRLQPRCSDPSPSYLYIARYDLNGHLVWSQQFGSPNNGSITGLAANTQGLFITMRGNSTDSILVRKYDLNGNQNWTSEFSGVLGFAPTISLSQTGIYVASLGSTVYGNNTSPVTVRLYSFQGSVIWTKVFGNELDIGQLVSYAASDALYLAGADDAGLFDTHAFVSKYDLSGTFEWSRQFDTASFVCYCTPTVLFADASGAYVGGSVLDAFPGQVPSGLIGGDGFLRKYDSSGGELYTLQFGPDHSPDHVSMGIRNISATSSGTYVTGGGGGQLFLLKCDTGCQSIWSFRLQDASITALTTSLGDSAIYLAGYRTSGLDQLSFIEELSFSSSLVFFGVNPPLSFGLVVLVAGLGIVGFALFRKLRRGRLRHAYSPAKPAKQAILRT